MREGHNTGVPPEFNLERVRELVAEGRRDGRLTAGHVREVLQDLELAPHRIESVYLLLSNLGINVVTDDETPDIDRGEVSGPALAIENARLRVELARREQLGELMATVVAAITSPGDLPEIMTKVMALAGEALGADSSYIALFRDRAWKPAYLWRTPPGFEHGSVPIEQMPFAGLALRVGRPVAIDDCRADDRVDPELLRTWGMRAVMMVPMVVRGELLGGLFFRYKLGPHHFSKPEIAFAESVAGAVSQALHAARLLEQQRRIAVTLQENLIHPLPEVEGLELSVVGSTAHESELVGGDFSDVFLPDAAHVAILIGDVAGKGLRAAGLTETVRSTVRAFAAVDPSPEFVLRMTNRLLLRRDVGEDLVTALLVIVDRVSGRATFASAAHPPPVHLSLQACGFLELPFGVPLGSFDKDYGEFRLQLTPDDAFVLYTDGVTEARRGRELFGYGRLVEAMSALRGGSMQELAEGVRDAAIGFAGRLKDDLHVAAFRLVGEMPRE
jgi:sigma-B regulation protein RsbU (phosphoserine phosphatase)